jgi:hypothetical protein
MTRRRQPGDPSPIPVIAVDALGNDHTMRLIDRALTTAGWAPYRKTVLPGRVRALISYRPGDADHAAQQAAVRAVLGGLPGPAVMGLDVIGTTAAPPPARKARDTTTDPGPARRRWRGPGGPAPRPSRLGPGPDERTTP